MTGALSGYLRRIGYDGPAVPTYATLRDVHRAHVLAIPYENLDIHLGTPLTLNVERIYEKIVERRRGGWCFEMNGLFAWALRELGFDVTMLAAAVNRRTLGPQQEMNHLALLVHLDRPYLADVGFGTGSLDPLPLAEGKHTDGRFTYTLERDGDAWRMISAGISTDEYDVTLEPRQLGDFTRTCDRLQSAPDSPFVRTVVCIRLTESGAITVRGPVVRTYTDDAYSEIATADATAWARVIREDIGIDPPNLESIWNIISRNHEATDYAGSLRTRSSISSMRS